MEKPWKQMENKEQGDPNKRSKGYPRNKREVRMIRKVERKPTSNICMQPGKHTGRTRTPQVTEV